MNEFSSVLSSRYRRSASRRDFGGLAYHATPEVVPGGFVSVDVFFVISGFLISTILLNSLLRDKFSFAEFYARRTRRIFPALLVVLIATMFLGWNVVFQCSGIATICPPRRS